MTKWILAAGAAALAITSPVLAERGGQGGDKGKGGQQAAKADKGGGNARAAKADRGGGNQGAKADRGGGKSEARAVRLSGSGDRGKDRGEVKARGRDLDRVVVRSGDRDELRVRGLLDGDGRFAGAGLINGCPPGLAKKL